MNSKIQIAVIGGDFRQCAVAEQLAKRNTGVCVFGLNSEPDKAEEIKPCQTLAEAIRNASAVVLPLPASTDGVTLNCPVTSKGEKISLDSIIENMSAGELLLGGRIPQAARIKAQARGLRVYDYFESEKLQIKNAYVTAEAAVSVLMNCLDRCVRGARVAITGTGRIARLLSELLLKLGAKVCVAARDADKLVYFELMGCKTLLIGDKQGEEKWYFELENGYDAVFNTVPSWLFDRAFLEAVSKKTVIIELASAPGGLDICAARELSSNVIWASSLPGKYAPYSAGELIAECVWDILMREVSLP